jgi:hypothetical protein
VKGPRPWLAGLVITALATSQAAAGILDLDIYGKTEPPALGSQGPAWRQSRDYIQKDMWLPGSPQNTQGAGPMERSISFMGNAAMGGWGVAQSWAGATHHDRGQEAAAIGFGLMTLWNALGLFQFWSSPGDPAKK